MVRDFPVLYNTLFVKNLLFVANEPCHFIFLLKEERAQKNMRNRWRYTLTATSRTIGGRVVELGFPKAMTASFTYVRMEARNIQCRC